MNTAFFTSRKGCLGRKVSNPSLESKKIGSILRADFDSRYKSIGKNTYVVSEKDYYPFCALKCFEFHVEVFASGNYFIHFYPATKFISSVRPIHVKYIHDLKRIAGSNTVGIFSVKDIFHCTLIKTNNLDLLQEDVSVKKDLYLTFTAEFISECSPAISKLIYKEAQKTLEYTVGFLERILVEVENLNQIPGLQRGPVEIEVQNLNRNDNLLVGSGECVEMVVKDKAMTRYGLRLELSLANQCLNQTSIAFIQDADRTRWSDFDSMPLPFSVKARIDSKYNHGNTVRIHEFISRPSEQVHVPTDKKYACYYSGVYRPVNGWSILPVVFGKFNLDAFKDSFLKLNRNVNDFHILEGVHKKVDDINFEKLSQYIRGIQGKVFVALLSEWELPTFLFDRFKGLDIKYRPCVGIRDEKIISDYVCKCIEQMRGIITIIKDIHALNGTYFIGLDLCHRHNERESILAVSLVDHRGVVIGGRKILCGSLHEDLQLDSCGLLFDAIRKRIKKPKHIIIHRDGKMHRGDLNALTASVYRTWGAVQIDIVEIIKSDHPMMFRKDAENLNRAEEGCVYLNVEERYSILTTSERDEELGSARPLVIRHVFGNSSFFDIVWQVFWLAKVCTANIYKTSRLPVTTKKAHDIAKSLYF